MKLKGMFTGLVCCLVWLLLPVPAPGERSEKIIVPEGNGKPVLLDGIFSPGEWDDALKVKAHERVDLLFKVNSGHFFLGLKFRDGLGVIVDLWLSPDDRTAVQFHSSGQLGEAVHTLPVQEMMPASRIGYTSDWDANEIKADSKLKSEWQTAGRPAEGYRRVLLPSDGKEFQILLSKFHPVRRLKMRFLAGDPQGLIVFPENTDLRSTENWLELVFPDNR